MGEEKCVQLKPHPLRMGLVERRKHPRFECELPVDCITSESEIHAGIAANISRGGMLICLHDRIEVGAPLRINLIFTRGFQLKIIRANAIVVWKRVVHRSLWGRYRYGMKLVGLSDRFFPDFKGLLGRLAREYRFKNLFPAN